MRTYKIRLFIRSLQSVALAAATGACSNASRGGERDHPGTPVALQVVGSPTDGPPTQTAGLKSPPPGSVVGHIQSVHTDSGWGYLRTHIKGYACQLGVSEPIEVHAYAEAPFGGEGSVLVAAGVANKKELGTRGKTSAGVCASAGHAVFFDLRLPYQRWKKHEGKRIFVHGIAKDTSTSENHLLMGSGAFSLPLTDSFPKVIGKVESVSVSNDTLKIDGWVCESRVKTGYQRVRAEFRVQKSPNSPAYTIGRVETSVPREDVKGLCKNGDNLHGFSHHIPYSIYKNHAGLPIRATGVGYYTWDTLENDGVFTIPE